MMISRNDIYKSKIKIKEAEGDLPTPPTPPAKQITDETIPPVAAPNAVDNLDADMLDDGSDIPDLSAEAPSMESSPTDMSGVLRILADWKGSIEQYINACIKGSELLLASDAANSFITKEQQTAFEKVIDDSKDILKGINDIGYDAEKVLTDIELSKKIYYKKKESMRVPGKKQEALIKENDSYDDEFDSELNEVDQPTDDDFIILDSPKGGYDIGIVNGKFLGHVTEWEDAEALIRAKANEDQYYPAVWNENDHGNLTLINFNYNLSSEEEPTIRESKETKSDSKIKTKKVKINKGKITAKKPKIGNK